MKPKRMAKPNELEDILKKQDDDLKSILKPKNVLSKEDYWEWRTSVEEVLHGDTKLHARHLNLDLMKRDKDILELKIEIARMKLDEFKKNNDKIKEDYKSFLDAKEAKVGFSIKDCAIDPITLEVTSLK